MKTAAVVIALLAAQAAAAEPVFDRAALMAEAADLGFASAEEKFLATAKDDAGQIGLAQFYMANELWPEALAVLKRLDAPVANEFAAECEYRMGRYAAVAARLDGAPATALSAMALTRLGAYAEAWKAFDKASPPHASRNLTDDYRLAKAETLIETGDPARAADAIARVSGDSPSRRRFLLAESHAARGDEIRAAALYRSAAAGDDEWAMRARLATAMESAEISAIEALALEWQGGAFERDLQLGLGRLRLASADYDRGFAALHIVVDRSSRSDAAIAASDSIAQALPQLLADDSKLDAKNAARLFFENVEFAPPGHDGDRLIQEAVKKLDALGLYAQAAQILDHQVMKRLRGAERAAVAADLAQLFLTAKRPEDALRAIRSTRIAGLSAETVQQRRRLEAEALAATGRPEAALTLLGDVASADDLRLRAEISWAGRDWAAAARDYAAYVAAVPSLRAADAKTAAVRAATAFLLVGDRAGYRAFAKEAALRLEGTPEAKLIATLGDVDRERFLAGFMESYRSVYEPSGS